MISVELTGTLPNLDAALHKLAATAVAEGAFAIRDGMKDRAPVDSGALQAGISAITAAASDYDANVADARERNPQAEIAEAPTPADDLEAFVVAPVGYSAYVNYGTSRTPAQPFAEPAIEAAEPQIAAAFERAGGTLDVRGGRG